MTRYIDTQNRASMKYRYAFVSLCVAIMGMLSSCADTPTHAPASVAAAVSGNAPSRATAGHAPVVIPIHAMQVGHKLIYYITIQVGNAPETKALLDTGSVGLRVAEGDVPPVKGGHKSTYGYTSGVMLDGNLQHHDVRLGTFTAHRLDIDVVHKLYCSDRHPGCNVSRLGPGTYFTHGVDGISSSDVGAILGTALTNAKDAPNPLVDAGFKRWIISLPRSVTETGSLILDPTPDQVSSFYTSPVDRTGRYRICMSASADATACEPGALDTGAPHVDLWLPNVRTQVLPSGEWVQMTFGPPGLQTPVLRFQAGKRNEINAIIVQPLETIYWREPFINAGVVPFLHFDVLFDAKERCIGLRSRD